MKPCLVWICENVSSVQDSDDDDIAAPDVDKRRRSVSSSAAPTSWFELAEVGLAVLSCKTMPLLVRVRARS